jgi:hypothetical protein
MSRSASYRGIIEYPTRVVHRFLLSSNVGSPRPLDRMAPKAATETELVLRLDSAKLRQSAMTTLSGVIGHPTRAHRLGSTVFGCWPRDGRQQSQRDNLTSDQRPPQHRSPPLGENCHEYISSRIARAGKMLRHDCCAAGTSYVGTERNRLRGSLRQ